jgi:hypothetical protein
LARSSLMLTCCCARVWSIAAALMSLRDQWRLSDLSRGGGFEPSLLLKAVAVGGV